MAPVPPVDFALPPATTKDVIEGRLVVLGAVTQDPQDAELFDGMSELCVAGVTVIVLLLTL